MEISEISDISTSCPSIKSIKKLYVTSVLVVFPEPTTLISAFNIKDLILFFSKTFVFVILSLIL